MLPPRSLLLRCCLPAECVGSWTWLTLAATCMMCGQASADAIQLMGEMRQLEREVNKLQLQLAKVS